MGCVGFRRDWPYCNMECRLRRERPWPFRLTGAEDLQEIASFCDVGSRICNEWLMTCGQNACKRNGQDHSQRFSGTLRTISPLRRRGRPMCLPAGRHCEFARKRKNRTLSRRAHTVRPYGMGDGVVGLGNGCRPGVCGVEWPRPFPTLLWNIPHHLANLP